MKATRRQFLHLAAGAGAVPAVSRIAWAQAYPTRPVRIIVGYPSGGSNDILARLMAQWLSERMGQQFVIENRPGAGSNIATEAVVRADPDGYTLLMVSAANMSNAALYEKLSYNFIRDIAPVASIGRTPYAIVVTPSFPAKTVPELIAYAKANPGKINMASAGNGSAPHIFGALFIFMAGSIWSTCRIAAVTFPICSAGRCRSCFVRCLRRSAISKRTSCGRWRSPPRRDGRGCRTCRARPNSCRAMT